MFNDLGYEDMDEFEDAIQGSFQDFLRAFPHIVVKEEGDKWFYKVLSPEPAPPRKLYITVSSAKQLVETTLMKAMDAELEVPQIEFAIGAAQKRHIDSLYNHIATAKEELETHCKQLGADSEEGARILETVETLSNILDVDSPFDIVLTDPSGLSEFKP